MSKIIKWFLPSSEKIARSAAEKIQTAINSADGATAAIAKYSTIADQAVTTAKQITGWLSDGKLSDVERDEIAAAIRPLVDQLMGLL